MLDAPMFAARWRWTATTSLALPRFRSGKKVPPQLQRMAAEDLLAAVFPDQIACPENLVGPREMPDHPLVNQTVHDCLHDAMDIEGLENLLRAIESGEIRIECRELTEPSPLALEILGARPYAFLDDAPLEERRTRAVMSRRWLDEESAAGLGRLDPNAIERVRTEAWPSAESADELHDALLGLGFVTEAEIARNEPWRAFLAALAETKRVTKLSLPPSGTPEPFHRRKFAVGRRRTPAPVRRRLPARAPFAADRRPRGICRPIVVVRRSAGRDRPRPAPRSGTGDGRGARRLDGAAGARRRTRRSPSSRRKASR